MRDSNPLKLHDLKLVEWQIDKIISPLSQDLRPLNLTGCWLQGGCSECKRLSHYWILYIFQKIMLEDPIINRNNLNCNDLSFNCRIWRYDYQSDQQVLHHHHHHHQQQHRKISDEFILEIQQISEFQGLNGLAHFWPYLSKNQWCKF